MYQWARYAKEDASHDVLANGPSTDFGDDDDYKAFLEHELYKARDAFYFTVHESSVTPAKPRVPRNLG